MSFSDGEVERYARHLVLREIGGPGQQKLKAARVLLVGMGGLGARPRFTWPRRGSGPWV
jgi:molybdopterin/thiamine biosynthesis adenylyltransferase